MLAIPPAWQDHMKPIINHLHVLAALGALLAAAAPGVAGGSDDAARAAAKLAEVRGRITALTSRLSADLAERDALGARLRDADLGIADARRRLEDLRLRERVAERHRADIAAQQAAAQRALDGERRALAAQARAAYVNGQEPGLKLLLNQQDPASAGRMAMYYGFFLTDQAARIADIDARRQRLKDLTEQAATAAAQCRTLAEDAAHQVQDLQKAREQRVVALGAAAQRVSSGATELSHLKREEQAEEALVTDLAQVLKDFPIDGDVLKPFAELRGRLAWPVPGRLTARYADARGGASDAVHANGVFIAAPRGAKVRAPYSGRVVYADWLQGLGLLLIIGHQGNFMTLYGNAEVLYKSVGDSVAAGDVIASVGDAGGASPALYFEIREGRKPLDTKAWLRPAAGTAP